MSTLTKLFLLVLAASAGAVGTAALFHSDLLNAKADDTYKAEDVTPKVDWVAAAPGRVEPKSGLIRVGSALLGRIAEVPVKQNDKVEKGELLIRLDDDEAR